MSRRRRASSSAGDAGGGAGGGKGKGGEGEGGGGAADAPFALCEFDVTAHAVLRQREEEEAWAGVRQKERQGRAPAVQHATEDRLPMATVAARVVQHVQTCGPTAVDTVLRTVGGREGRGREQNQLAARGVLEVLKSLGVVKEVVRRRKNKSKRWEGEEQKEEEEEKGEEETDTADKKGQGEKQETGGSSTAATSPKRTSSNSYTRGRKRLRHDSDGDDSDDEAADKGQSFVCWSSDDVAPLPCTDLTLLPAAIEVKRRRTRLVMKRIETLQKELAEPHIMSQIPHAKLRRVIVNMIAKSEQERLQRPGEDLSTIPDTDLVYHRVLDALDVERGITQP